jgi:hypothetical protein
VATRLLAEQMVQSSNGACVLDITPPTFAGIASASPELNGSFLLTWLAASDLAPPIYYEIYGAVGVVLPIDLFTSDNKLFSTEVLSARVFTLKPPTSYLLRGQTYTFGVRARDASGNLESNSVVISAVALGSANVVEELVDALTLAQAVNPGFGQSVIAKTGQNVAVIAVEQ